MTSFADRSLSMSRRGNCWDNAVAESFFGTLKTELFLEEPIHCADLTEAMVVDYIDGFYNPVRRHSSIGYMSPVEYELRHAAPARGGSGPAPRGGIKMPRQEGPAQAA